MTTAVQIPETLIEGPFGARLLIEAGDFSLVEHPIAPLTLAGPSHVHPELGPFAPPAAARLNELNRAMLARAAATDEARERWRIGEPYRGADLRTLVVRPRGDSPPLGFDPPNGVNRRNLIGIWYFGRHECQAGVAREPRNP